MNNLSYLFSVFSKVIAALVVLTLSALPVAAHASTSWTRPSVLSIDGVNGAGNGPVMSTSPDGTVYAAWSHFSSSHYSVQVSVSHDGGLSWTSPQTVSDPLGHAEGPQITFNDSGVALVYWTADLSGTWSVQSSRSADSGGSWSPYAPISDVSKSSQIPSVIGLGDHGFIATFDQYNGSFFDVVIRTSSDDGSSWSPFQTVSDGVSNSYMSKVASNSSGVLAAAWHVTNGFNFDIFTATSSDGGVSWSTANGAVVGDVLEFEFFLMPAESGEFTLLWSRDDGASGTILSMTSSLDGAAWGPPTVLTNNSQVSYLFQASHEEGLTAVSWATDDGSASSLHIVFTTDGGITWAESQMVATLADVGAPPFWKLGLVISPTHDVVICWTKLSGNMSHDGDVVNIIVSRDVGQTWSEILEPSSPSSFEASVAFANGYDLVAAWTQGNPDGNAILASTTVAAQLPNTGLDSTPFIFSAGLATLFGGIGLLLIWGRLRESNSRPTRYE